MLLEHTSQQLYYMESILQVILGPKGLINLINLINWQIIQSCSQTSRRTLHRSMSIHDGPCSLLCSCMASPICTSRQWNQKCECLMYMVWNQVQLPYEHAPAQEVIFWCIYVYIFLLFFYMYEKRSYNSLLTPEQLTTLTQCAICVKCFLPKVWLTSIYSIMMLIQKITLNRQRISVQNF